MRNPTIAAKGCSATLQPSTYSYRDLLEFQKDKFRCFAPTHHNAVIMGSIIQDDNSNGERFVPDANIIKFALSQQDVREGLVILLSSSSSLNEIDTQMSAEAAADTCAYYYSDIERADNAVTMANKALIVGQKQSLHHSTFVAAKFLSNNSKASLLNVGDGILLLIDGKTHRIKHILHPRKYIKDRNAENSPTNIQDLVQKSNALSYVDYADVSINPNDIIIVATAGFIEHLSKAEKKYTVLSNSLTKTADKEVNLDFKNDAVNFIQYEINVEQLNQKLQMAFENTQRAYQTAEPPAFAIAQQLIDDVTRLSFEERQQTIQFAKQMQEWVMRYRDEYCKSQIKQYQNRCKELRVECAQRYTPEALEKLRQLVYIFRSHFFVELSDGSKFPKNNIIDYLFNEFRGSCLNRNPLAANEKGKVIANENNNELTHDQIRTIFINSLKTVLEKNGECNIDEMVALATFIFDEEVNDFARKLTLSSFDECSIKLYIKTFIDKISLYDDNKLVGLIEKVYEKKDQLALYLRSWSDTGVGNKEVLFVSLFKEKSIEDNYDKLKKEIAVLLSYIRYINKNYNDALTALPNPIQPTVAQFKLWFNATCLDEELKQKCQLFLQRNNIKDNALLSGKPLLISGGVRLHRYQPGKKFDYDASIFSIDNLKLGDDLTLSVAYVPDPALEIIRAMTIWNNKDDLHHREQLDALWQQFCGLYPKVQPTLETLEQILDKLRAEKHIDAQSSISREVPPYINVTKGQKFEDVKTHVVQSHSESEILNLKQFLLPKVKLQQEVNRLHNIHIIAITKSFAHDKLKEIILNDNLCAIERLALYDQLQPNQYAKLNEHRHSSIDNFFGINMTRSWSRTLKEIRDNCLQKLTSEVQAFRTGKKYDEALALLNKSLTHPLFNQHRNNAKVIGAFGDTAAVKEIRKQIAVVTAEQNAFHLRNSLSA